MKNGRLIVAGNHILNKNDIPYRTREAIQKTKIIVCDHEETFKKDLEFLNISIEEKIILPYYKQDKEHWVNNEQELIYKVLEYINSGNDILLIVDNGMPGFADCGLSLINACHINNIKIEIIPGPSVISTIPSIAGVGSQNSGLTFQEIFSSDEKSIDDKIIKLKDIDHLILLIFHPQDTFLILNKVYKIFNEDRFIALCLDVGTEYQKIIRGNLSQVIKEFGESLNNKEHLTSLVIQGKLIQ